MARLIVVLLAFLGWAVVTHRVPTRRLFGSRPDAFQFPTGASHAGIEIDDPKDVADWCREFDCSEEQLRAAVKARGRSVAAVRDHLTRPR